MISCAAAAFLVLPWLFVVPLLRSCVWLAAAVLVVWMAIGIWKGHYHRVRRVTTPGAGSTASGLRRRLWS